MTIQKIYHFAYNLGIKAGLSLAEQANLCRMLQLREIRFEEVDMLIEECKELLKPQS